MSINKLTQDIKKLNTNSFLSKSNISVHTYNNQFDDELLQVLSQKDLLEIVNIYKNEVDSFKKLVSITNTEYKKAKKIGEDYKTLYENEKEEVKEKEKERCLLERRVVEMRVENERQEAELMNMKSVIVLEEEKMKELVRENKHLQESNKLLILEKNDLKKEFIDKETEFNRKFHEFEERNVSLSKENEDLIIEKRKLEMENEEKERKILNFEKIEKNLNEEIGKQVNTITFLVEQVDSLSSKK